MARNSKEREFRERQQIRWYQWEFLRRNPDYRRDYDAFVAQFGPWFKKRGFWYELQRGHADYSQRDLLYYYNKICPAIKTICAKWCISDPFPPEWVFNKSGYYSYAPRRYVSLPTGYSSEDAAVLWNIDPVGLVSTTQSSAFVERFRTVEQIKRRKRCKQPSAKDSLLLLKIDITRPDKELLPEIRRAIQLHRDRLSRSTRVTDKQSFPRRRFDQYSDYVRVWDLRKAGRTFPQIAKEIFPKEYPQHPTSRDPIHQRVADHFRRAQTLIYGGYKELA